MTEVPYEELKLVGFDGTAVGECGLAVPVARHRTSGLYVRLEPKAAPEKSLHWYDDGAIQNLQEQGRLTLIDFDIDEPPTAFAQAMALYVTSRLLDALCQGLPKTREKWFRLQETIKEDGSTFYIWATFDTEDKVVTIMDSWAEALCSLSHEKLREFLHSQCKDRGLLESAEDLALMALSAAIASVCQERAYLLYAAAVKLSDKPDRLGKVFDTHVRADFPQWSKRSFNAHVRQLIKELRYQASVLNPGPVVQSRHVKCRSSGFGTPEDIPQDASHSRDHKNRLRSLLPPLPRATRTDQCNEENAGQNRAVHSLLRTEHLGMLLWTS